MNCIRTAFCIALALLLDSTASAQFATPSPEHELLQKDVGVWKAEVKMWMNEEGKADESVEPTTSIGEETNRMLGSFWVVSQFKGDFGGFEFEGHSVNGYDPKSKKYIGTWVDSTNPHPMHMEGTYDPTTKTLTSYSKVIGMDGTEQKGKSIIVYKEDGSRVMTMYDLKSGTKDEYTKSMEVTYRRK